MTTSPKTSEYRKLLLLSLLVGLCSGAAAVVLSKLIHFLQGLVLPLCGGESFYLSAVFPALGMLLSLLLVRFLVKDDIGHGVTKVLKAISTGESRIAPHNMYSSILTSSLTIGFGGSVGAEAPIVFTGAAFGSNLGRFFGLSGNGVKILVGCGAAGAIAGIFKAPLAGVLFTLEILLFNMSMTSLTPLLLSTVSATVVSYVFLGEQAPFQCATTPFAMVNIPFYVLLGIFCGLISLYFQRLTLGMEDRLRRIASPYVRWVVCALCLAVTLVLFPPLFGEGYVCIGDLLNNRPMRFSSSYPLSFMLRSSWGIPVFFLLVMLVKVAAMTFTNAGGGVGGTFGPTLFVGALAGFVLSRSLNLVFGEGGLSIPEQNFVLVGMGGAMAGVMQAPMTAIFLIAEITGGYSLFLPLIITSTVSYGVTRIWERYSIYTKRLAQTGELLTHDSDRSVLTLMDTSSLVRDKYPKVLAFDSLRTVVNAVAESNAAVMAVLDRNGRFVGMIVLENNRKKLMERENYDRLRARDLMEPAPTFVYKDEKMESVMDKFDSTEAWRLPVVDSDGTYLGFISRSRILMAYRQKLKEFSQE